VFIFRPSVELNKKNAFVFQNANLKSAS